MARSKPAPDSTPAPAGDASLIRVRRIHRRDLNRVWEFLKRVFRSVNRETVEYQRPRTKTRFLEIYEEEGIEQLLFEITEVQGPVIVGYAECAYEVIGSDNWINERYFENRDMRPLFVEEIAISPDYQGRGIGSFVIEQLEHLARVRGCTHLVLEVAANNRRALHFYRARSFFQLDAAIFLAKKVVSEPELLPPRALRTPGADLPEETGGQASAELPPPSEIVAPPELAPPVRGRAPARSRRAAPEATADASGPARRSRKAPEAPARARRSRAAAEAPAKSRRSAASAETPAKSRRSLPREDAEAPELPAPAESRRSSGASAGAAAKSRRAPPRVTAETADAPSPARSRRSPGATAGTSAKSRRAPPRVTAELADAPSPARSRRARAVAETPEASPPAKSRRAPAVAETPELSSPAKPRASAEAPDASGRPAARPRGKRRT